MTVWAPDGSASSPRLRMALRPIGYIDLLLAEEAVAKVAPDWTVELSAITAEETSVVIMPEGADDLIGPTYIIFQDQDIYRLDQLQWDVMTCLGTFVCVREAIKAMVTALERIVIDEWVPSRLRH